MSDGWRFAPFDTVVRSRGSGISGLPAKEWQESGAYPVIGQGAQDVEGWTDRSDLLLAPPSPVVLYGGHTRRVKHVKDPFVPGPNVKILESLKGLHSRFLFYYLTYLPVESKGYADHFPLVRKSSVPIPSEHEQRRIVAILDEAFDGITTAKVNAEKNLQNSVDWASCQLTEILESESKKGGSGTLDALVASDCSLSYGIVQPGEDMSSGLPIVRPVDLGPKVVGLDGLKRIDPALARSYARTTLKGNDLLLCVRGTTGTVSMADSALAGANVTRGIVPIRFDPKTILQRFGYYLLRSSPVQHQIRAKTYGAALMQINIGDLRQVSLSFPPLERQPELLEKLDAVQESADRLVMNYQKKLMMFEELKKSLLHQAFTGQL